DRGLWHSDGAVPHLDSPWPVTPRRLLRRPRPPPSYRRGCSRSTSRARAPSSAWSRGSPSGSSSQAATATRSTRCDAKRTRCTARPARADSWKRHASRPAWRRPCSVGTHHPTRTTGSAPPLPAAPVVAPADAGLGREVIYVEDGAALAELLEYGLRAHGYRFLAYRNGREALRELLALDVRGTRPLLLLDVDLPALDGYSI